MADFEILQAIKSAEAFFKLLDDYLIEDLKTMVGEIPPRPVGGVGYPAVHSILTGMELLGFCMSKGNKNSYESFEYFWAEYLVPSFPAYSDLHEIFRKVIRTGTAHWFLVKSGVSISKSGRDHLRPVRIGNRVFLNIDLKTLFSDFKYCYEKIKNSLLVDKNKPALEAFFCGHTKLMDEMIDAEKTTNQYLTRLKVWAQTPESMPSVLVANASSSTFIYPNTPGGISGTII